MYLPISAARSKKWLTKSETVSATAEAIEQQQAPPAPSMPFT